MATKKITEISIREEAISPNPHVLCEDNGELIRVPFAGTSNIDKTLTQPDRYAEAKAVGDAIKKVTQSILDGTGIGEGVLKEDQLTAEITDKIQLAVSAMQESVYDPRGYKRDVFAYVQTREEVLQDGMDKAVETLNTYIGNIKSELADAYQITDEISYEKLGDAIRGAIEVCKQYTLDALDDYNAFTIKEVTELPDIGVKQTFYLLKKSSGYEKYWWIIDADGNGRWDSFGRSSTLVLNRLPETGEEDIDYIIQNGDSYVYWKWIDNQWKVVAGSMVVVLRAHTDENGEKVDGQLPDTGNELTDYYLEKANGAYQHYRWIDEKFVLTGGDIENDTAFQELEKRVSAVEKTASENQQNAQNLQAGLDSLKGYVNDVTQTETGFDVSFGDGTSKEIKTQDNRLVVEDIQRSENGIIKTYTDGTTEEIEISGGSGGTSSGGITITRIGDATQYCIYGDICHLGYNMNAFDAAGDTVGAGTATWHVGGIAKVTSTANQGDNSFDIGPYLSAGQNTVKVSISVDTGGETRTTATKTWTVNAVNLYFEWERDDSAVASTDVAIRWTPYGDLNKTTHILLDGEEIATSTTTRSGTLQTYTLPMQNHGAHMVELYVTAMVNNLEIETSHVTHDIIFAVNGDDTPIIGSSYAGGLMQQYDTIAIPIVLYDPSSLTTSADVYVDGEKVTTWRNIDRTVHYWNYSPTESGTHILKVVCGTTIKTWTVTVTELAIDNAEVEGYTFRMKASEFAGNDALQEWNSNGITATFSENFDWQNGGIQSEIDGKNNVRQYICIKAGTTLTINHQLFEQDCTTDGKNIKIMFRLANCRDYDAKWFDCYSDGIGLRMYAQSATLNSEQSEVGVPYYEGITDPIELEFDVWPKSRYAYIIPWIDGVQAGVKVYPQNDAFVQPNAKNITIGSADCDVYLYMVKAYDNYLTNENHIENFIADAPNAQEMVDRYNRNDILDANGKISYLKLAQANPGLRVHVFDIVELFKGDKEADAITGNSYRMFLASEDTQNAILTAENVSMKIQGTSSVGYYDATANWDAEFKEKLTDRNGNIVSYQMDDSAIAVDYINYKVNEASCEGSNNAVNAEWYNKFQPYIRPFRANTPGARDTMQFQPGVCFFRDRSGNLWGGDSESYNMYAVVAAGNSKKNYAIFHDRNNPLECCMEIANNTSEQCLMIVPCSDEDVRNTDYFEFRYPKQKNATEAMFNGWKRFVNWMYSVNPAAATGEALPGPVTFEPYTVKGVEETLGETQAEDVLKGTVISDYAGTYTNDTEAYRMAKLLQEIEDYMVLDSVTYHYLFIERHTMIDNVAKNTFWGSHDLIHWYLVHNYDDDTADGNDNEGGLTLTYGYETQDIIGTKNVFNAHSAVWLNIFDRLYTLRRVMYINREGKGAWDSGAYLQAHTNFQRVIPERVRVQDYWYKYLRRYEENQDDGYLDMLEGGLKTYQRWQYEVYQEAYIASEYAASLATNDRVTLRTYTPTTSGLAVAPKNEITITMYAKMYINILIGSISKRIKAERGQAYTLTFTEAGQLNDTESYLYSASMIQAVGDISHLYPGYMSWANATRLRSLQIGSNVDGYVNHNAESIAFGANRMLEDLIISNLPNAATAMDLSGCQSLRYVDARGSGFTGFTFANGGVLETALLPSPASISLRNLPYLKTFSMEGYENLTSITVDTCPVIETKSLIEQADNLVRVRLIGIDWIEENTEISAILARLYTLRGRDENDADVPHSVLTGSAWLTNARERLLEQYKEMWSNLTITYGTLVQQYELKFEDWDHTLLFVEYIDRGGDGTDPVATGLIPEPSRASTESKVFSYIGWNDNLSTVISNRTVTAQYEEMLRQYSVIWAGANGKVEEVAKFDYGSEAICSIGTPTKTDAEGTFTYSLFDGWDQSTACVTGDMVVNARWQTADLPPLGTDLENMNLTQFYGIRQSGKAKSYVTDEQKKARCKIVMGYEPEFDNVESVVLAENMMFDGQTSYDTGVKLLDEDRAWTMMVDGIFDTAASEACLVSCFTPIGYHGFKVKYSDGFAVQWSTNSQTNGVATTTGTVQGETVITAQQRELAILRHEKGSRNLKVYISRPASNTILETELVKTVDTHTDATIVFGSDNNGENFANGTLYRCRLWYGDLGENECRKMAAWPREEAYLEVVGTGGAYQTNGQKTSIDLIHAAPLCCIHRMNPTNTNAGGWPASEMKSWMENRYIPALPEPLQNMLAEVLVSSVGYIDGKNA